MFGMIMVTSEGGARDKFGNNTVSSTNDTSVHTPVLISSIDSFVDSVLDISPDSSNSGISFLDLTLGGGGYALAFLSRYPDISYFALDQDTDAIERSKTRLREYENNLHIRQGNFADVKQVFPEINGSVAFAFMDLGLSSDQLADMSRGFSFNVDGPLDMRMDADNDEIQTAADYVNYLREEDLANAIYEFGEERASRRIARFIVQARKEEPITTTGRLAELVSAAVPRRGRLHPATRTFQALRILVNSELDVLRQTIPDVLEMLRPGGRLFIISYHSLEDRIAKHTLKDAERAGQIINLTRKKIVTATFDEVKQNPRSRSAKMRIAEKREPKNEPKNDQ